MRRLPIRGSSLCTPERDKKELEVCLKSIELNGSSKQIEQVYHALASIIGSWWQQQESLQAKSVTKGLLSLCRKLREIAKYLKGHHSGLRDSIHIEVTTQVQQSLAKDANPGDLPAAATAIEDFVEDAERMANHCTYAYRELTSQHGPRGRPELRWYDDFTELLLQLADEAGKKATISTNRHSGERSGWLLTAARELESFLPKAMRSLTTEALVKRLARSKRNLRRQKRSAA